MFASVSRCAEPISQPCQLKVKVTGQGHGFEPWFSCPLHISYTPGRIFFGHMFASVRRCAELITQPWRHKVKVTVHGHMFEPWISCPLCISYTSGRIFFKLWSNVHLSKTMCRINNSTIPTRSRSQFKVLGLSLVCCCFGSIYVKRYIKWLKKSAFLLDCAQLFHYSTTEGRNEIWYNRVLVRIGVLKVIRRRMTNFRRY